MPKLKPVSSRTTLQKLRRAGFVPLHQRGSHLYLEKGSKIASVPMHSAKHIPIGTLHNIVVHQAGLSIEEFNNL